MRRVTTLMAASVIALASVIAPPSVGEVGAAQSGVERGAEGDWLPLPDGTKTVLLVTGADGGFRSPLSCNGDSGGSQYRAEFDRWLAQQAPDVERVWISTGNIAKVAAGTEALPLEAFLPELAKLGYRAIGVGWADLNHASIEQLLALQQRFGVPFLTSNVMVHETGRPAFHPAVVLETRAGKVALVGVSPHNPNAIWGSPTTGTIVTTDAAPAVQQAVDAVRGEAALVLLVAAQGAADTHVVMRDVHGVDFVVGAHGLHFTLEPSHEDPIPVMWFGAQGQVLGRIALGEGGRILDAHGVRVWRHFPIDPQTGERRAAPAVPAATR